MQNTISGSAWCSSLYCCRSVFTMAPRVPKKDRTSTTPTSWTIFTETSRSSSFNSFTSLSAICFPRSGSQYW